VRHGFWGIPLASVLLLLGASLRYLPKSHRMNDSGPHMCEFDEFDDGFRCCRRETHHSQFDSSAYKNDRLIRTTNQTHNSRVLPGASCTPKHLTKASMLGHPDARVVSTSQ